MTLNNFVYLFIDLVILIPSIIFFNKVFKKRLLIITKALIPFLIIFLIWDYFAISNNDWYFNQQYIMGISIASIPIEEILFFVSASLSSILIYFFLRNSKSAVLINRKIYIFVVIFSIVFTLLFIDKGYTGKLFAYSAMLHLAIFIRFYKYLDIKYLKFVLISFIPFFLFNLILTGLPVVLYSQSEILNIRLLSIPIEDFIFSYLMLTTFFIFFRYFQDGY